MDKDLLLRAMQGSVRIKGGDGKHSGKASRGDVKRVARLAGTSAAEDAYCKAVDTVIIKTPVAGKMTSKQGGMRRRNKQLKVVRVASSHAPLLAGHFASHWCLDEAAVPPWKQEWSPDSSRSNERVGSSRKHERWPASSRSNGGRDWSSRRTGNYSPQVAGDGRCGRLRFADRSSKKIYSSGFGVSFLKHSPFVPPAGPPAGKRPPDDSLHYGRGAYGKAPTKRGRTTRAGDDDDAWGDWRADGKWKADGKGFKDHDAECAGASQSSSSKDHHVQPDAAAQPGGEAKCCSATTPPPPMIDTKAAGGKWT